MGYYCELSSNTIILLSKKLLRKEKIMVNTKRESILTLEFIH